MTSHAVLIGDGPLGERLVRAFAADGTTAILVSDEERVVERARDAGIETIRADPAEAATFDRPELVGVESAIVAARTDGENLLLTQLLRVGGTERVVALVNDPQNLDAFADAGVEAVCAASALAAALASRHRRVDSAADRTTDAERVDRSPLTLHDSGRPVREDDANGRE